MIVEDLSKVILIICNEISSPCTYLNKDNILYKLIAGEIVGKRAIQTNTLRHCWLEDINPGETIKSGYNKNLDYCETFQ